MNGTAHDVSWQSDQELVQDPRYARPVYAGTAHASWYEAPPSLPPAIGEVDDRLERAVLVGGITAVIGVSLCTASAIAGVMVGLILAA